MPTLSGELHGARYIEQGATVSPHLGLAYAEYTLPDTNFLETRDRSLHIEGSVAVADYAKQGTTITAQVEAATAGTVSFPLFDYDGYRATLNGQEIAVETGDNNRVQIRVPAGTDGEVRDMVRREALVEDHGCGLAGGAAGGAAAQKVWEAGMNRKLLTYGPVVLLALLCAAAFATAR